MCMFLLGLSILHADIDPDNARELFTVTHPRTTLNLESAAFDFTLSDSLQTIHCKLANCSVAF